MDIKVPGTKHPLLIGADQSAFHDCPRITFVEALSGEVQHLQDGLFITLLHAADLETARKKQHFESYFFPHIVADSKDHSWDAVKDTHISQLDAITDDLAAALLVDDGFGHKVEIPEDLGLDHNWNNRPGFLPEDETTLGGISADRISIATYKPETQGGLPSESPSFEDQDALMNEVDDHNQEEAKNEKSDDNDNSSINSNNSFHSATDASSPLSQLSVIAKQNSTYTSPPRQAPAPSSSAESGTASSGGAGQDP